MGKPLNIIFFKFFQQLKKEVGIELDMNQYQDFLHLFILKDLEKEKDVAALLNMAKTLWLTKPQYEPKFEYFFSKAIKELIQYTQVSEVQFSIEVDFANNQHDIDLLSAQYPDELEEAKNNLKEDKTGEIEEAEMETERSAANHQSVSINFSSQDEGGSQFKSKKTKKSAAIETPFTFTGYKHLPIPNRKAQQTWRRLKNVSTLKDTEQLDLKETVNQIAKNNFADKPIYQKEKNEHRHFILLQDHLGNMTLFDDWAKQLKETLEKSNKNCTVDVLYYYQYPEEIKEKGKSKQFKLFKNKQHTKSILTNRLIQKYDKDVGILIFSEGGALEHHVDDDRMQATWDFMNILKANFDKIVWFNPLPKEKWSGSSAIHISFFTPMQVYNLTGIENALKILEK